MACTPATTQGGCTPVIVFEGDGNCDGPAGGTPTLGTPSFALDVTNPPDLTWRDEDFVPIQADDDDTVFVFDNV